MSPPTLESLVANSPLFHRTPGDFAQCKSFWYQTCNRVTFTWRKRLYGFWVGKRRIHVPQGHHGVLKGPNHPDTCCYSGSHSVALPWVRVQLVSLPAESLSNPSLHLPALRPLAGKLYCLFSCPVGNTVPGPKLMKSSLHRGSCAQETPSLGQEPEGIWQGEVLLP